MKISTTWTQADWNNALKKVWGLAKNFDEILEFGLEHGFITSSDIIHASDMYRDPDKMYDDPEIEDFVKSVPFSDLMKTIQNQYSIDDIIDEMDKGEIMDVIGDDELFSHIENSVFTHMGIDVSIYDQFVSDHFYVHYGIAFDPVLIESMFPSVYGKCIEFEGNVLFEGINLIPAVSSIIHIMHFFYIAF